MHFEFICPDFMVVAWHMSCLATNATQSTIDHLPQLHIKRLNLKGIQTFSYHGAQIISRIALSLYAAVLHAQPQQHTAETRNNHVH